MSTRFVVGIDLGTSNTVVAYAPLDGGELRTLEIDQLVDARHAMGRTLLPSTLYAPLDGERVDDSFSDAPWVVGEYARRRGAEVVGRSVASSKSWLTHAGVDRTAPILPWGAPEGTPRVSPLEAGSRILAHVKHVWDAAHATVDAPLAEQDVVLTVPASFDEVARELTLEAATHSGLSPKLLEEPQAAFYDWMARTGKAGIERLLANTQGEARVLVVDVGGGTTDLSLIRVSGVDRIERIAVGSHLLLGGDNMDLALAHTVEPRLVDEGRLDSARFAQLAAACRAAKEALLGAAPPDDVPLTITGPGAKLIGSTRTTRIGRDDVERIVLDGFLPMVSPDDPPFRARGALVAFGLPYERDVAITRHVAAFLTRHSLPGAPPNALLLNGGVFRAARIADRVVSFLTGWRGGAPIDRLPDADPDLAVARGAARYALARRGEGVRIGGGAARGYFVDVSDSRAVCVVPRGAEEGVVHTARGRTFALAVGRPVKFELLVSDHVEARAGDVVDVAGDAFTRMPPLATTVEGDAGEVRVELEGELTPLGTLDLACVEVDAPSKRHRLAFQVRSAAGQPSNAPPSRTPSQLPKRMDTARDAIDRAYGKARTDATGREAKDLLRELERILGDRTEWTTDVNRGLYDALLPIGSARRRSADHERVFWLLAGWCIRPGFGAPLDAERVKLLVPLLEGRLAFPGEARSWQQFFIAWRRAAGGLDEAVQTRLRDFVDPALAPAEAGLKKPKKPPLSLDDALEMAASLERVTPARRAALGGWVLERTWTHRDPRLWAAVGRVGARVPAYASVHHVVSSHVAERWLDHLLRENWDGVPTAARAAVQLARRTGDRARDVAEPTRADVERRLVRMGADEAWIKAVREIVPVEASDREAFFGDALPLGLRLED